MRQNIIKITSIILSVLLTCSIVYITKKDNSIQTRISSPSAVNGKWIDYTGNGDWCFKYEDGHWAANEYIDNYWIDSAGWYDSAWNGNWNSNSTGWWFESNGWYPSEQWLKIDGNWYYFKDSGYMAANEWIGNYYLTNTGAMATNTWIGEYYVGSDGAWIPGYKESSTKSDNTTEKQTNNNTTEKSNTNKVSTTNDKSSDTSSKTNTENDKTSDTSSNKTTTEDKETNSTTKSKVYTIFDPSFHCEFDRVPIAGYDEFNSENLSKGWYNNNYIVCNLCNKKYSSYEEFRNNDTCCIKTFTDSDTIGYWSDKTDERVITTKYDYYFDYCQKYMGCIEYQYAAKVHCATCGKYFDSGDEFEEHCDQEHNGFEHFGTENIKVYEKTYYPELISVKEQ